MIPSVSFLFERFVVSSVAALVVLPGLGMQGIGDEAQKPAGGKKVEATIATPVAVAVKTDKKSYQVGEAIKATITVKNPRKAAPGSKAAPVPLTFSNGQKYEIEVRKGPKRNGEKVWRWSDGRMFTDAIANLSVETGKPLTFTETLTPGKAEMPVLEPGTYTLVASITLMGRMPRPAGTVVFSVKK